MDLIEVEYEVLPHVMNPVAAMQPDAVVLHDDLYTQTATGKATTPSNVAEHLHMGRGDVGRGLAAAEVVIERTLRIETVHQGYLEPDFEAAWVRGRQRDVWANTRPRLRSGRIWPPYPRHPAQQNCVVPTEVGKAPLGARNQYGCQRSCGCRAALVSGAHHLQPCRSVVGHGRQRHGVHDQGRRPGTMAPLPPSRRVWSITLVLFRGALRSAIRRCSHIVHPISIDAYDGGHPHVAAYRAPGATRRILPGISDDEAGEVLQDSWPSSQECLASW